MREPRSLEGRIASHFDRKAPSFDAIYSGEKTAVGRWWDARTRQNLHDRFRFTLDALAPVVGKRVLDVGCGSGRYGVRLAQDGATEVVGVDLAGEMLVIAERLAREAGVEERCTFLQEDVLDLAPAAPFDAAIALGFFDYVREPEPVMAHLRRLTAGPVVASFPARWAWRVPARWAYLTARGCPVRFFGEEGVRALCGRSGWRPSTLVRRGPIYLLVAYPEGDPASDGVRAPAEP